MELVEIGDGGSVKGDAWVCEGWNEVGLDKVGFGFDAEAVEGVEGEEHGLGFVRRLFNMTTGEGMGGDVEAEDFGGGIAVKVWVVDYRVAIINLKTAKLFSSDWGDY